MIAALAISANAYSGVSKLFIEENGDLFNSISISTRYELLNNFGRDDKTQILNDLQTEESQILALEEEYMKVATSSAQTVEIKLLHRSKRDTVIAVIETVKTPYKDSRLTFYDINWKKLDSSKFITLPTINDFLLPSTPKDIKNDFVNNMMMSMIEMKFEGNTMIAELDADMFMSEGIKTIKPYFTPKVVYTINGSKFKKRK